MERRSRRSTRNTLVNYSDNNDNKTQKDIPPKEPVASDSESEDEKQQFEFDGKVYDTYKDMVAAKRKRNEDFLKQSGLWKAASQLHQQAAKKKESNGIKRRKVSKEKKENLPRRQSSRLQGTPADGRYIEDEKGNTFTVATEANGSTTTTSNTVGSNYTKSYAARRVNDGEPLSLEEAVNLCEPKWIQETSVQAAKQLVQEWNQLPVETPTTNTNKSSMDGILSRIENMSVDDDNLVAKVTPDRIFSVATHPSVNQLIVGAGDKNGYVGLWNVDGKSETNDGVHLFRPHTRSVNSMHWTSQGLLTSSYDGTVRYFDVAKESFEEVFSVDDEDDNWYTQYLAMDTRANRNEQAFFLSTSIGTVYHVDRRIGGRSSQKGSTTWNALLSEEGKKINSVSLHPDGFCLATAGLDRKVRFWDLRMFSSGSIRTDPKEPKGAFLGEHETKKSINSAFFSPSGTYLVATTMSDTLNIYKDSHLRFSGEPRKGKKGVAVQPEHTIRHNNQTGRWLTTFNAQWHPSLDIFSVGSMQKPRAIDIFDGGSGDRLRAVEGDALTAVASRCCFHPSTKKLVLVGGNSSGRVTIIR